MFLNMMKYINTPFVNYINTLYVNKTIYAGKYSHILEEKMVLLKF